MTRRTRQNATSDAGGDESTESVQPLCGALLSPFAGAGYVEQPGRPASWPHWTVCTRPADHGDDQTAALEVLSPVLDDDGAEVAPLDQADYHVAIDPLTGNVLAVVTDDNREQIMRHAAGIGEYTPEEPAAIV